MFPWHEHICLDDGAVHVECCATAKALSGNVDDLCPIGNGRVVLGAVTDHTNVSLRRAFTESCGVLIVEADDEGVAN